MRFNFSLILFGFGFTLWQNRYNQRCFEYHWTRGSLFTTQCYYFGD